MTASRAAATRGRRQAMLDAALDLFLERGVAVARIEDILKRSNASVGSFYHHFGSKVELAAALYLEILDTLQRYILEQLAHYDGAEEGIKGIVRAYLRWVRDNPQRMHYLVHCREPEVARASEGKERMLNTAFYRKTTDWLRRQTERGAIRKLQPEHLYALWIGPADLLIRNAIDNLAVFPNASAEEFAELLSASEDLLAEVAWQVLKNQDS